MSQSEISLKNSTEWAVVNFVIDEKVSVIPSSWLNVHEGTISCYWPPKNAGKHIKGHTVPDENTWDKWEVSILNRTNSYVEAREYVKLVSEAEDGDNHNMNGSQSFGRGQRKRKIPVHLNNTWEEEDDEENHHVRLTPPPYISIDNENTCETFITPTPTQRRVNKKTIVRTVSTELLESTQVTSVSAGTNANPNLLIAPNNSIEDSPILKNIMNQLGVVRELVQRLVHAEERRAAGGAGGNTNNAITNFEFVPKKTFTKYRKLLLFDDQIKSNKEAERQNEAALFLLGGSNYKEQIRRGLRKLFSDKLAIKCSWTGRKNNFRLQQLNIIELLKSATRKKFGQLTDADYQHEVALWFRQAQLRYNRSEMRNPTEVSLQQGIDKGTD